jgi:hypothetical protein
MGSAKSSFGTDVLIGIIKIRMRSCINFDPYAPLNLDPSQASSSGGGVYVISIRSIDPTQLRPAELLLGCRPPD